MKLNKVTFDFHHASPMMVEIAKLRDKYDLHMCVLKDMFRMIQTKISTANSLENSDI